MRCSRPARRRSCRKRSKRASCWCRTCCCCSTCRCRASSRRSATSATIATRCCGACSAATMRGRSRRRHRREELHTVVLPPGAYCVGKTLADLKLDHDEVTVTAIRRDGIVGQQPDADDSAARRRRRRARGHAGGAGARRSAPADGLTQEDGWSSSCSTDLPRQYAVAMGRRRCSRVGILFVLLLLRRIASKQYERLAATPQDELLEMPLHVASRTTAWFLLIAAVFLGLQTLELPAEGIASAAHDLYDRGFWQTGLWATTAVLAALERKRRMTLAVDRAAAGSLGIIGFMARADDLVVRAAADARAISASRSSRCSPASASAASRSRWPRRTSSATCSHRCRSRSTGRSSSAMRCRSTTSSARSSTSA